MRILVLIFLFSNLIYSQEVEYKFYISFIDKNYSEYDISKPKEFLSDRSLERRQNQGIQMHFTDLPVSQRYISLVRDKGCKILNRTKWLNGVVVSMKDSSLVEHLHFSFIDSILYLGKWTIENKQHRERFSWNRNSDYGSSLNQMYMLWGDSLHHKGFKGDGKVIAVLDAGFYNVDSLLCFAHLFETGRILGTYDFVEQEQEVFNDNTHGMSVLSTMAANIEGEMLGTAPLASYYLLRTEDAFSENLIEEYNWVCGAEFADSAGADIINSSLGYTRFDNNLYSYSYADLDGRTAVSTIGATICARKGIIVVNSAGNEGDDKWKYIAAPADADSILSVGAVDENRRIASFSSYGPSFDGRVKPSVCAQGQNTTVISSSGHVIFSNGTSFSSPVLAGMVACLWEAHSKRNNIEVIDAIIRSSRLYTNPNNHEGYGLANFYKADSILTLLEDMVPKMSLSKLEKVADAEFFVIELYTANNYKIEIDIYDNSGNRIYNDSRNVDTFSDHTILIPRIGSHNIYKVYIRMKKQSLSGEIVFTD